MSKHPIDHDRARNDSKVAQKYSRIEREKAGDLSDPKVKALTKGARPAEAEAEEMRLKAFLKIQREQDDS